MKKSKYFCLALLLLSLVLPLHAENYYTVSETQLTAIETELKSAKTELSNNNQTIQQLSEELKMLSESYKKSEKSRKFLKTAVVITSTIAATETILLILEERK